MPCNKGTARGPSGSRANKANQISVGLQSLLKLGLEQLRDLPFFRSLCSPEGMCTPWAPASAAVWPIKNFISPMKQ
jgi:hypothetical protein